MDAYFKNAEYKSVFASLEYVFNCAKYPKITCADTNHVPTDYGIIKPIDELIPFYFANVTVRDIALIRLNCDITITRDELLKLIEETPYQDLKNFYSMFLFEPITFIESAMKLYNKFAKGIDLPELMEECLEKCPNPEFTGKNTCMLSPYPLVELGTI